MGVTFSVQLGGLRVVEVLGKHTQLKTRRIGTHFQPTWSCHPESPALFAVLNSVLGLWNVSCVRAHVPHSAGSCPTGEHLTVHSGVFVVNVIQPSFDHRRPALEDQPVGDCLYFGIS